MDRHPRVRFTPGIMKPAVLSMAVKRVKDIKNPNWYTEDEIEFIYEFLKMDATNENSMQGSVSNYMYP